MTVNNTLISVRFSLYRGETKLLRIPRTIGIKPLLLMVSHAFKTKIHYVRLYRIQDNHDFQYLDDPVKTVAEYGVKEDDEIFVEIVNG